MPFSVRPIEIKAEFFANTELEIVKVIAKKDVSLCGWRPLSIGDVFTVTGRQSA